MYDTHATLVGTVVTDPYRRHSAEGAPFIKFRMVSNARRFDKASQEWVAGDSLFVNVTCWRRLVKGVGAGIGKGDPVIVAGRLYTHEWGEEGHRRSSIELDADAVGPDLARCVVMIDNSRRSGPSAEGTATDESAAREETAAPEEVIERLTVDVGEAVDERSADVAA